ncbi:MAG: preprotein translocase subunit YajC [Rhodospirillaceae bacterium]|nr:preprotein translocase subunit YajC [Rhodospirillaceae bacterium]
MFVSPAYAQAAATGGAFDLISLLPLVLIFVVFYFLMIRPQQKKVKEHRTMLGALRRGDRVVTAGGIIGVVTKIPSDNEVIIEIAKDVRVTIVRSTITEIRAKAEPADDAEDKGKDDGGKKGS